MYRTRVKLLPITLLMLAAAMANQATGQDSRQTSSIKDEPILPTSANSIYPSVDTASKYVVTAEIAELKESAFALLQTMYSLVPQDNGAMLIIPANGVEPYSRFLKKQQQQGQAKILSRPQIVTRTAQAATVEVGRNMPMLKPADRDKMTLEYKSIGLQLDVTVRDTKGKQFIDWKLSKSTPLHTADGQGIRTSHGIDGSAIVATGDMILVATPALRMDTPKWTIATLQVERVSPQNNSNAASHSSQSSLPATDPFTEDVQSFASGPEPRRENDAQAASSLPQIEPGRVFLVTEDAVAFETTEHEVWTLKCPFRVRHVSYVDADIITANVVQSDPKQLTIRTLQEGVTTINLVYEDRSEAQVELTVTAWDRGLNRCLERLYPRRKLRAYPINGSVLLRGVVRGQKEQYQVRNIAEEFFPNVLDQLTTADPALSEESLPETDHVAEFRSWAKHIRQLRANPTKKRIRISKPETLLFLTEGRRYSIKCPEEIRSCDSFDKDIITVGAVADDPSSLTIIAAKGSTKLHLSGRNGSYAVDIVAEGDVASLSAVARRLYPERNLVFMAVRNAVIARGIVKDEKEALQVVEIAEQFYPNVLNHLIISEESTVASGQDEPQQARHAGRRPLPEDHGKVASATVTAAGFARTRDDDIKTIRREIKALHNDVRGLIEILKQRQADQSDEPAQEQTLKSFDGQLLCFHADYCEPCQKMMPIVDRLAAEFPTVVIRRVDVTKEPDLARKFQVDRIPSYLLVRDGRTVRRSIGVKPETQLRSLFRDASGLHQRTPSAAVEESEPLRRDDSEALPTATETGVWLIPVCRNSGRDENYLSLARRVAAQTDGVWMSGVVSAGSDFSKRHGITSFPTLVLTRDGEIVDQLAGPATEKQLKAFIDGWKSYLSRRMVPFDEASVVAIRRIDGKGRQIHPVDDVGVIIASEPGRSIIAVPAGAMNARQPDERVLVYLFPGTDREQRLAADIKWDFNAIVAAEIAAAANETDSDVEEIPTRLFALLEIQPRERLPVCKPATSPQCYWSGELECDNETAMFPLSDGESFAVFRPRPTNATKARADAKDRRISGSEWVSIVWRQSQQNWVSNQGQYQFCADFSGAVVGINKEGRFLGFGQATPQESQRLLSLGSPAGAGRSTIRLADMMDIYIGWYFGCAEELAEQLPALRDPLVLTAVHPVVVSSLRARTARDRYHATMRKVVGQLGIQPGHLSEFRETRRDDPYHGGLLISNISPNSPAATAGIWGGDILLGMNGYATLKLPNLEFILKDATDKQQKELSFLIQRSDQILRGTMRIDDLDVQSLQSTPEIIQTAAEQSVATLSEPASGVMDARRIPPRQPLAVTLPVDHQVVIHSEYGIVSVDVNDRDSEFVDVRHHSTNDVGIRLKKSTGILSPEISLSLEGCESPFKVTLDEGKETEVRRQHPTGVLKLVTDPNQ